jgi:putative transposase
MTHQEENPVVDHVMAVLIEHGPAAMASAFATIMNLAMQIERQQALKAESHQRTEERRGYANGYKPKTMRTRVGEVSLRIPQTRGYHDDEGRPFYPKSLERGVRSERAVTLAVAEMYVKGVSTRKVTAVVEKLCGFEVTSTQGSRAAAELDEQLSAWRNRPLGEITYLILDAGYEKIRHGGALAFDLPPGSVPVLKLVSADLTPPPTWYQPGC